MASKYDPAVKDALLSKDRVATLDTHRVMSFLPLMPYHKIADVGSGPGYFTIPLAKFTFDGKVIALDLHQEMLDAVREAADRVNLGNVETVISRESKVALSKDSVDGALVAFVLGETSKPEKMLKDLRAALMKGGWLGIIDWNRPEENGGPSADAHMAEDVASKLATAAGFRFTGRYNINLSHYMLVFRS